jgi:tRNA-2-methylthio-N6-dimethylallyladenosine synthase
MPEMEYILKVKEFFGERKHTYFVETYGCQMNVRDSQTLRGFFEEMGYELSGSREQADAVIFNTCCVREGAEDRLLGNLGKLKGEKKKRPDMLVMICGCMMQEEGSKEKIKKRFPFVDVVFGTHNTSEMPKLMYNALTKKERCYSVWESEGDIVEDMPVLREKDIFGWINIMYGCNNFCSYCIVPYVRGRERSRRSEDIINEAVQLAKSGVKEITLLGQNVNSYGKSSDEISFPELLRRLNKVDGIERIRFMTSHPKDLSDELIQVMAECEKVCKYIHLPLQSGSDRILKMMNRRYTRADYLTIVKKLRAAMPEIAISTDIIVGFPTETDEDFQDTFDLYNEVKFNSAFTFIYSPRINTPAAKMEGRVSDEKTRERMARLIALSEECSLETNKIYLNKTYPVLVEGKAKREEGMLAGKTDHGRNVTFMGTDALIGKTVNVKITGSRLNMLKGELEED